MMSNAFILLSVFTLSKGSLSGDSACPEVQPQKDFNITSYVTGRWYIQQQMSVRYLPASQNYCVYAEYKVLDKPTFWGYTIQVHNYAQEKDGKAHDSGSFICAKGTDAKEPAKLQVGPCFLPRISGLATGPYWILSYNEAEGYALISGGQPTIKTKEGCRTGSGTNGAGLWIFTRKQQRDEALVQKVRGLAQAMGFDLTVLNNVDQTHCSSSSSSRQIVI